MHFNSCSDAASVSLAVSLTLLILSVQTSTHQTYSSPVTYFGVIIRMILWKDTSERTLDKTLGESGRLPLHRKLPTELTEFERCSFDNVESGFFYGSEWSAAANFTRHSNRRCVCVNWIIKCHFPNNHKIQLKHFQHLYESLNLDHLRQCEIAKAKAGQREESAFFLLVATSIHNVAVDWTDRSTKWAAHSCAYGNVPMIYHHY